MISEILEYVEYVDGDLFISKKWAMNSVIGKRIGRACHFNKVSYKKEDLIWVKFNGEIPAGKVVSFKVKNSYKIDDLHLIDYKHTNGRPRGSFDKEKRRVKNSLSVKDERFIRENWGKESIKGFMRKFDISKSTVTNIRKEMKLQSKLSISNLIKNKIDINETGNICGIYAIITNDGRSYIGSSDNISRRLKDHLRDLKNNIHVNKSLQSSWNSDGYFAIIEECDEQDLLSREYFYIDCVCKLHNVTKSNQHNQDFFNKAYEKINNKINVNENNCWEFSGCINRDGYKYIKIGRKTISIHRVMFYHKNPHISQNVTIRHNCNNKTCCNPDHLTYGSSRDNSLDIKREEMALFEKRYQETCGDVGILCDEFNIGEKTVRSRMAKMKLVRKYGRAKRKGTYVRDQNL